MSFARETMARTNTAAFCGGFYALVCIVKWPAVYRRTCGGDARSARRERGTRRDSRGEKEKREKTAQEAREPKEGGELNKPPRKPSEPIFERKIIEHVLVTGSTMGLLAFGTFWFLEVDYTFS